MPLERQFSFGSSKPSVIIARALRAENKRLQNDLDKLREELEDHKAQKELQVKKLQKRVQELKSKVEEAKLLEQEATLRETLHRAIANGDPAQVVTAFANAKKSFGPAELSWAEQFSKQAEMTLAEQSLDREVGISLEHRQAIEDMDTAEMIKRTFERSQYPSIDSLVPIEDLRRFLCLNLQEKDVDHLMDHFLLQHGSMNDDNLICYKAFIDFLYPGSTTCSSREVTEMQETTETSVFSSIPVASQQQVQFQETVEAEIHIDMDESERAAPNRKHFGRAPTMDELNHAALVLQTAWRDRKKKISRVRSAAAVATFTGSFRSILKSHTGLSYHLLVLGAGPAGVQAAVECAHRGFRVGLIDPKEVITGAPTGLHSKCLREAALKGANSWPEIESIISQVGRRAEERNKKLLATFHIEVLKGWGSILDEGTILFQPLTGDSVNLTADCVVIATGSRSNRAKRERLGIPFHVPGVFDSDTIGHISYIPERMVVSGAGIIAIEYALIFAYLGSKVTILHYSERILKMLDRDLKQALVQELAKWNVEIRLNVSIRSVHCADGCTAELPTLLVDTEDTLLECDCFLSCIGRVGVTEGIGLENLEHLGMKVNKNQRIEVDRFQHTGVANIYAVGDVSGGFLASEGQAQACRAIKKQFGSVSEIVAEKKEHLGYGVWTIPEIAWVGLTEEEAEEQGIDFATARAGFGETVRGMLEGDGDAGFLKLIFDTRGKVLGVHICGDQACDLINHGVQWVNAHGTIRDILQHVFPAVTVHETYHVAAHKADVYLQIAATRTPRSKRSMNRQVSVSKMSASMAWNRVTVAFQDKGIDEDLLYEAFTAFDTDQSGQLSADEIHDLLNMLGLQVTKEVVSAMLEEADNIDENSALDFAEFKSVIGRSQAKPDAAHTLAASSFETSTSSDELITLQKAIGA